MFNPRVIKIILIIALIGLISYIWIDSNSLSCNQCTVTFREKLSPTTTYNMSDLFTETKTKDCPIYWDRVQGYVKG